MYMHNNHCHRVTAHLQSNILYIIYYGFLARLWGSVLSLEKRNLNHNALKTSMSRIRLIPETAFDRYVLLLCWLSDYSKGKYLLQSFQDMCRGYGKL